MVRKMDRIPVLTSFSGFVSMQTGLIKEEIGLLHSPFIQPFVGYSEDRQQLSITNSEIDLSLFQSHSFQRCQRDLRNLDSIRTVRTPR